jgi:hypothetical protein
MRPVPGRFAILPESLLLDRSLSAEAKVMYGIIASWTPNKKDGLRYIHRSELATAFGIKELQVSRLTRQLCASGWLTKSGDGGCNRPARYLPLQEKTLSSEDRSLDACPILSRQGQSVNTLNYKISVSVANPRARENDREDDADHAGDKNRFYLPTDFRPEEEWLIAARQARAAAGKPSLSPGEAEKLLIKFVSKKGAKRRMDWKLWRRAFIDWFVSEDTKTKKTVARKESAPSHTASPLPTPAESPPAPEMPTAILPTPEVVNVAENADAAVTAPIPSTPPHDLSGLFKALAGKTAMPRDTGYQSRPAVRGAQQGAGFQSDPDRRAFFAAQLAALEMPIPANCAL